VAADSGRATVIGAGTIGLSWTALFLARGLQVQVNSRRPDADRLISEAVLMHAPAIPGCADPAELLARVGTEPDVERSLAGADIVQESGPENLELKQDLFASVERAASPQALLLSSTSTFSPVAIAARMKDPGRLIVGHPFNPPHVMPLVEVVASQETSEELIDRAAGFYREIGKAPVVLRRAPMGFVANRLQAALLREAVHLVREGVVTVDELDRVVTSSIGLRWAVTGPFQTFHLGGGPGGLRHWLSHLGVSLDRNWEQLGRPTMDRATQALLIEQAERAFGGRPFSEQCRQRDARLTGILRALGDVPPFVSNGDAG